MEMGKRRKRIKETELEQNAQLRSSLIRFIVCVILIVICTAILAVFAMAVLVIFLHAITMSVFPIGFCMSFFCLKIACSSI